MTRTPSRPMENFPWTWAGPGTSSPPNATNATSSSPHLARNASQETSTFRDDVLREVSTAPADVSSSSNAETTSWDLPHSSDWMPSEMTSWDLPYSSDWMPSEMTSWGPPSSSSAPADAVDVFLPWDNAHNVISAETMLSFQRLMTCWGVPLFFLTGAPLNVLNCLVFYRQGLRGDRMNLCLFCLALVDLLFLTFFYLVNSHCAVGAVRPDLEQWWKYTSRKWLVGVHRGFLSASGCLTAIISLERCVCIVTPLNFKTLMSARSTGVLIAGVVLGLQLATLIYPLHFAVGSRVDPRTGLTDFFLSSSRFYADHKLLYTVVEDALLMIVVPVACFTIVSVSTAVTVLELRLRQRWREGSMLVASSVGRQQVALVRMLVVVSLIYIVTAAPNVALGVTRLLVPEFQHRRRYANLFAVTHLAYFMLALLNSSVNFFIYAFRSSRFRSQLLAMVCRGDASPATPSSSRGRPVVMYTVGGQGATGQDVTGQGQICQGGAGEGGAGEGGAGESGASEGGAGQGGAGLGGAGQGEGGAGQGEGGAGQGEGGAGQGEGGAGQGEGGAGQGEGGAGQGEGGAGQSEGGAGQGGAGQGKGGAGQGEGGAGQGGAGQGGAGQGEGRAGQGEGGAGQGGAGQGGAGQGEGRAGQGQGGAGQGGAGQGEGGAGQGEGGACQGEGGAGQGGAGQGGAGQGEGRAGQGQGGASQGEGGACQGGAGQGRAGHGAGLVEYSTANVILNKDVRPSCP